MKTLFAIIISSVLAAVICLTLVSTGIISFKKNDTESVFHQVQNAILKPQVEDNPEPVPKPLPEPVPETDRQEIIFKEAAGFLRAAAGKGTADIEEQFKKFLKEDQNLDDDKVQKFLKMSFWKNFVTLQNIESADRDKIRLEFARELELKKAGFAAKGITLMEREIESAENIVDPKNATMC